MAKAWSYFETDEEVFKAILKGLTNEEKALLKKQFGKDYDGINVRTSIKKNEKNDLNALCERILIDVAFAKKLKANGKVIDNYITNSSYNALKKLAYTYDIDTESLNTMINSLTSNERQAFIYYFGIDRKKMTIFNISNLLSTDELNTFVYLKSAISSIKRKCENSLTINKSKINLKNKEDIPANFSSQLIKKGYTLKEINIAAKQLSNETYLVLKKYYGRDLNQIRSFMVIVNDDDKKLILDALYGNNSIEKKIVDLRTKREEKSEKEDPLPSLFEGNLQVYYQKLGYSKNAFIEAFRNLNSDDKKTLFLGFDHSFNSVDISKYTKDVIKNIYRLAFSTDKGLQYYLIKNSKNKKVLKNNLYDILERKGYKKDYVKAAISTLTEAQKNRLFTHYDKDLNLILSYNKDTLIYSLVNQTIPVSIQKIKVLNNKLEKFKLDIYSGYSEVCHDYVDIAIIKLTEDEHKLYDEAFDENGKAKENIFTNLELEKLLIITIPKYIQDVVLLNDKIKDLNLYFKDKLYDEIQIKFILNQDELNTFYNYYDENLCFKENSILDKSIYIILEKIADKLKNFNFYELFEFQGYNKRDVEKVLKESGFSKINCHLTFNQYMYFKSKINRNLLSSENNTDELTLKYGINVSSSDFYKKYKEKGSDYELVNIIISTLPENDQKDIRNIFEEDENKVDTIPDYKIRYNSLHYDMINSMRKLKNFIKKTEDLYDYFNKIKVSNDDVNSFINKLSTDDKIILYTYYDENLIRKNNVNFDIKIYNFLNTLFDNIKELTCRKGTRKCNLYDKYAKLGYSSDIVNIMLNVLPEEKHQIIAESFDENGNQIVLKLNNKLSHILNYSIPKYLGNISQMIDESTDLYKYIESFNIDKNSLEDEITKLSEQDKNILYAYYDKSLKRKENITFDEKIYVLLDSLINNTIATVKENNSKINIYKIYQEQGFSHEMIDMAISLLSDDNKSILKNLFDENRNQVVVSLETKKLNGALIKALYRKLKGLSTFAIETKNLYNYFETFNIDKQYLDDLINELSDETKDILYTYYNADLIRKEDMRFDNKIFSVINILLDKNKLNKKRKRKINFYVKYQNKGFSREKVDIAISLLSDDNKTILNNFFDKDGNKIKTLFDKKDINNFNNLLNNVIYRKLEKISAFEAETINLYSYFKTLNMDKDYLDDTIDKLSDEEKNILYTYYNKDLVRKDDTPFDIAIYNILHILLDKSKVCVKNKINLYSKYQDKGFSHEMVDIAINLLSEENKILLKEFFDEKGNKIKPLSESKDLSNLINRSFYLLLKKVSKYSEETENLYNYFELFNINRDLLDDKISNLSDEEKKILYTYYNKELIRNNDIPFDIKIYNLLTKSLNKDVLLQEKGQKKINLYSKYQAHGFNRELVDIAISLLSEDKQKKIRSCFNSKGNQIKVLSEENGIYNILGSSLPIRLKKIAYIAEKTQNLEEYLVCYDLTKEDIKKYIETLSDENQNIFYNYYDENLIKKDDAVLDINIYQILNELIENRNNIKKTKLRLKGINLFDKYEKKHWGRNLVEAALSDLSPKSLSIIKEAFDEDENQIKTIESCKGLSQIINIVLVKKIQAVQEYSEKMEDLYSYFIQRGFNELELKTALLSLNKNEKQILDTYYNGFYKKYVDAEFNKDVYVLLKNIEDKISSLNLYEKYNRLGYTRGEVDKAISMMDTYKKNSLKNYLDGSLNFIKSIRKNDYMINIINVIIPEFLKKIKNEGYFPNIYEKLANLGYEHNIAEIMLNILPPSYLVALKPYFDNKGNQIREYKDVNSVTRIFKNVLPRIGEDIKKFNNETEYLYDYFKDKNYCKVRVDKIISELNDNEKQVLYTYYDEYLSRREDQKLDMALFEFINNLEEKLSYHNLYDMYKDMGYTKEDVDLVLNTKLHSGANSKLHTYFDEELNLKKEYLKGNYVYRVVNELIPSKLHELKKEKNDSETINKFLFDSYLKEIKDTNVFNEKTISSLNISDEKKYYLNVEFVFNKLSTFKSEDIATLLKMDHSEYISNVYYAILSARNILNATLDDSLQYIKKVLDQI